jgi:4'-phosphopantetheinyl transferase
MMDRQTEWRTLCGNDALPDHEVHVWRAGLAWSSDCMRRLTDTLSPDEQERAARFHFDIDRRRHIVARGLLRRLLARVLRTTPDRLRFDYSATGKPRLAGDPAEANLEFNVSHSGDLVLIAVTVGRAVGIDVERIRADMAVDRIAAQFFSARECAALAALPPHLQCDGFFACWTRKEAYIKARGDGLSLPLNQFDVSLLPGQPARLLETRPDPAEARRWVLQELNVGPDHKAALAVEGEGWQLKTWDCPADIGALDQFADARP